MAVTTMISPLGPFEAAYTRTSEPPDRPAKASDRAPERAVRVRELAAAAALPATYEAHGDFVLRNLRRLGVLPSDLDDKTQEVFVIAHRHFANFEDRGHGPRAWLFQIALRVASDARRHRRRHPEDPDGGAAQEERALTPRQPED